MQVYLPIAEVSINAFTLLGLGGITGLLSGLFGVGGGFLMTPLLLFLGIAPPVAIATESTQIVASSFSGFLAHAHNKTVDLKMGLLVAIGGLIGVGIGIVVFNTLKSLGHIDLLIRIFYIVLLSTIGILMFIESLHALVAARDRRRFQSQRPARPPATKPGAKKAVLYDLVTTLPLKVDFQTSGVRISCIPVLLIGLVVGILAAIMGIGGGFIMVPAMIYILKIPTKVVVGTSLFQVVFIAGFATILHTVTNSSVDLLLAGLLSIGGVIGAQAGTGLGVKIRAEKIRILFAVLILIVVVKFLFDFLIEPHDLYSITGGVAR